jgi:hypothetical protein
MVQSAQAPPPLGSKGGAQKEEASPQAPITPVSREAVVDAKVTTASSAMLPFSGSTVKPSMRMEMEMRKVELKKEREHEREVSGPSWHTKRPFKQMSPNSSDNKQGTPCSNR